MDVNVQNANAAPGSKSYWWILKAIVRLISIVIYVSIDVAVYFSLVFIFYPLRWIFPKFYWADFDAFLLRELMRAIGYWLWSAGYRIIEYGDNPCICQNRRTLVVVNHQSTADVPTLLAATCKKGVGSGKMTWILDVMFKFIPPFGWIGQVHGDFFIQQGRDVRDLQGRLLAAHMRKTYWNRDRRWFIVFPEGGFLHKRLQTSQQYARDNGFPVLNYVTLPRVGAVLTMLETANPIPRPVDANGNQVQPEPAPGPGFRYLLDVTIAYPNGQPVELWDFVFGHGTPCDIAIHYRLIKIENVRRNNFDELRDFLYELWAEKDRKLEFYYREGHFPDIEREDGVEVEYHLAGLLTHNGSFFVVAYYLARYFYWKILASVIRFLWFR